MDPGALVLVTDGAAGQALSTLAAVRALAAAGYAPAVTFSARFSLAAASRHCALRMAVPPATEVGYARAIRDELSSRPYLTVLPTSDAALVALGAPVQRWIDKLTLQRTVQGTSLKSPPTEVFSSFEDLIGARGRLTYPLVVKSLGPKSSVRQVKTPAELDWYRDRKERFLVQPYLGTNMRSVAGIMWGGRMIAAVHQRYIRIWPPDCGGACAAETTAPDEMLEQGITQLMSGYEGIFHAQFVDGYLVDLNPRIYGSISLALAAGVNLVGMWCGLLRGEEEPSELVRARPHVFYRWLEGDLRSIAAGLKDRRLAPRMALRATRPRPGAAHGVESLRDPKPAWARLRYVAQSRGGRAKKPR